MSEEKFLNNLNGSIGASSDRQDLFNRFLTYRRRMARTVAIQVMYLRDMNLKVDENVQQNGLFQHESEPKKITTLCQEIIYFYKYHIFSPKEYGYEKNTKKIDEGFVFELTKMASEKIDEIDLIISKHLNKNWSIAKLDIILRNIFRVAVAEIMLPEESKLKVVASEYTNITSNFYDGKIVGFANGVLDAICKDAKNKD